MTKADFWGILIQAVGVFATLLVVILAIWGEWIRYRLLGPRLNVKLLDVEGTLTKTRDGRSGRYYKLRVSNSRRWAPGKNARVILTKLYKPAADGSLKQQVLSGPLQLMWQWSLPQYPTIGPEEVCTFGYILEGGNFSLRPYDTPLNFLGYLDPDEKMVIEVKAVADNAESEPIYIEVAWDGKWSDGAREMQNHLVVKETDDIKKLMSSQSM